MGFRSVSLAGQWDRPPPYWAMRPQQCGTRFLLTEAPATARCHCCFTPLPVLLPTYSLFHSWATGPLCNLRFTLSNSAAPSEDLANLPPAGSEGYPLISFKRLDPRLDCEFQNNYSCPIKILGDGLPWGGVGKNLPANAEDVGSIPVCKDSTCQGATRPVCHS